VLSQIGLLGAATDTTIWLYIFWHGFFPIAVIAYALLKENEGKARTHPHSSGDGAVAWTVSIVVAAVCGATLLATKGQNLLPVLAKNDHYTYLMTAVASLVALINVTALFVLWTRRAQAVLDLWLMVVICAWIFDISLSVIFNAGRFDLGFYVGRLYGLLATTLVLLVLLFEMTGMYARLARLLKLEQREHKRDTEEGRQVFDTSLDLILVTDRQGNFTRVSPSCWAILGYRTEEMIGHSAVKFIHHDDLDPTRSEMRAARRGGKHATSRRATSTGMGASSQWRGQEFGRSRNSAISSSAAT
jgi:PAS domain-containing protein